MFTFSLIVNKDFNDKFRDCIDKINNIAKAKGWKNGKDWAAFAVKFHLISESMKVDYDNCHVLRNSMSHGNAKNIVIHQATYSIAKTFLKIIEAKIRENKGNKKIRKFDNTINDRKYDKRSNNRISKPPVFSDTEEAYLKTLLEDISKYYGIGWDGKVWAARDGDINRLARSLQSSTEPIHKSEKLFSALKGRLYSRWREEEDVKAKKYYDILNVFLP
ncbi:MAG: hypothetical protein ACTTHU_04810 [Treponema sp.]